MAQPTVKRGSSGSAVKLLQERLTGKGFYTAIDGSFGAATEEVVEQFQASCGLTADGIVGPTTWSYVMAEGKCPTPADVQAEARKDLLAKIPAGVDPKVQAVLTVAIGALGLKETLPNGGAEIAEIVEWIGGDGKPPSAYYLHYNVTDKATLQTMPPWCCLFCSWALRKGLNAPDWKSIPFGNWFGGCSQVEEWAKKNSRWHAIGSALIPSGALFTISREKSNSDPASSPSAGHIGFIVCDNGDGTVTTMEGNVGNEADSYDRRKKSDLRGYAVWW